VNLFNFVVDLLYSKLDDKSIQQIEPVEIEPHIHSVPVHRAVLSWKRRGEGWKTQKERVWKAIPTT